MNVTLQMDQADDPPPMCPKCHIGEQMQQDFKAPGIVGDTAYSKAQKVTEDILRNDYHVADINRSPSRAKVNFQGPNTSTWGVAREALEGAITAGRQNRLRHGSGLDILQQNLKSGAQPDLIEVSKQRAMKVW